jgi:hypothetical protein
MTAVILPDQPRAAPGGGQAWTDEMQFMFHEGVRDPFGGSSLGPLQGADEDHALCLPAVGGVVSAAEMHRLLEITTTPLPNLKADSRAVVLGDLSWGGGPGGRSLGD